MLLVTAGVHGARQALQHSNRESPGVNTFVTGCSAWLLCCARRRKVPWYLPTCGCPATSGRFDANVPDRIKHDITAQAQGRADGAPSTALLLALLISFGKANRQSSPLKRTTHETTAVVSAVPL
jgi:hypothetical protein